MVSRKQKRALKAANEKSHLARARMRSEAAPSPTVPKPPSIPKPPAAKRETKKKGVITYNILRATMKRQENRRRKKELKEMRAELAKKNFAKMPQAAESESSRRPLPPSRLFTGSPSKMSPSTRRRRLAEATAFARKQLGSDIVRVTLSPKKPKHNTLSVEESVEVRIKTNMSYSTYRELRSKNLVASVHSLYQHQAKLLRNLPERHYSVAGPENEKVTVIETDLSACLKLAVYKERPSLINGKIRVMILGDAGGDSSKVSTKICGFLVDVDKARSCKKLFPLAVYFGSDGKHFAGEILQRLDTDIGAVQRTGLDVDGVHREFEFFLGGDLKFISMCLNLQGSSATYCCCFCNADKNECRQGIAAQPRSINDQCRLGELAESSINDIRRLCKSTNGPPFIKNIPIDNVVPPSLHFLMKVFGSLWTVAEECDKQRTSALVRRLSARRSFPSGGFDGKTGSRIITAIADDNDESFPLNLAFCHAEQVFALSKSTMMLENEVDDFASSIEQFFITFRQYQEDYANLRMTPSLHALEKHVVTFTRRHGSWMLFSEQPIEALHKIMNVVTLRIPARNDQRNDDRWLKNFVANQLLTNYFHCSNS